MKVNYRKIWEEHNNKKIPKGYHIHHVDGDKNNNDPSNLMCVSPEEHWLIHYLQGDPVALYGKFVQGASEAGKKGGAAGKGKIITEEQRLKQSKSLKETYRKRGKSWRKDSKLTEDQRKRISVVTKGENNPMYGKSHSAETRNKISETKKRKIETGEIIPHKTIHSEETRKKISDKRKEYYENGGVSPYANVYDVFDCNSLLCENKSKSEIEKELGISDKTFRTIYTYCNRNKKIHPKHEILILKKGKYHEIR